MFIDIHLHTAKYSTCSQIDLNEAIIRAKQIGLGGICITDHESNLIYDEAVHLAKKHDFLVIVGMEILSNEGDLLLFGIDEIPDQKLPADLLCRKTVENGGVVISAHPFRDNGRGMGNHISKLKDLSGVEAFNGNTEISRNLRAYSLSRQLKLPCLGGGDAHRIEHIGRYATAFPDGIRDFKDFKSAIKAKEVFPVAYKNNKFSEVG